MTVQEILASYAGQKAFFEPVGGNNGDKMIEMGSRVALEAAGIRLVQDAAQADLLVINGSGSVGVDFWSPGLGGLRQYAQAFNNRPLIMLPSSFHLWGTEFTDCFARRAAPAYIFAREQFSHQLIKKQRVSPSVIMGIDHDMSFCLKDTPFMADARRNSSKQHVLIVERFDHEGYAYTPHINHTTVGTRLKTFVPKGLRPQAKHLLHVLRVRGSSFTEEALRRIYAIAPGTKNLPVIADDISSSVGYNFDQFSDRIIRAAAVVTSRLHVGILAALLGKPTILYQVPGDYRKLLGVYQYSLSDKPNVTMWVD